MIMMDFKNKGFVITCDECLKRTTTPPIPISYVMKQPGIFIKAKCSCGYLIEEVADGRMLN